MKGLSVIVSRDIDSDECCFWSRQPLGPPGFFYMAHGDDGVKQDSFIMKMDADEIGDLIGFELLPGNCISVPMTLNMRAIMRHARAAIPEVN